MAKVPFENELLGKTQFKTYRLKCEKLLELRQKKVNELLSCNMTKQEIKRMQEIETETRLGLEAIDPEYARSCYPV